MLALEVGKEEGKEGEKREEGEREMGVWGEGREVKIIFFKVQSLGYIESSKPA